MAKKKKSNIYFGAREEEAVVNYLNAETQLEKDKIFGEILYEPLFKMVESIIKRYNLIRPNDDVETQVLETIAFIVEKFDKYKPEKNKKAYSYYGTIARNYLSLQSLKYNKVLNRDLSYEDLSSDLEENGLIESYEIDGELDPIIETYDFIPMLRENISEEMKTNVKLKPTDIKVGHAILDLLDNWETFINSSETSNILNRNKIIYYIRETTLLEVKDVRNSMKKYKTMYFLLKKDILGEE